MKWAQTETHLACCGHDTAIQTCSWYENMNERFYLVSVGHVLVYEHVTTTLLGYGWFRWKSFAENVTLAHIKLWVRNWEQADVDQGSFNTDAQGPHPYTHPFPPTPFQYKASLLFKHLSCNPLLMVIYLNQHAQSTLHASFRETYQWKSVAYARCVWSISGQAVDACLLWTTMDWLKKSSKPCWASPTAKPTLEFPDAQPRSWHCLYL